MDFQKIYARIRDIDQGKETLNESVVECGEMPMPVTPPAAPPVTMSVNFNAQGIDHIKELLGLMQASEGPLAAGPVDKAMPMPVPGMPAGAPAIDAEPEAPNAPDITDLDSLIKLAGVPAQKKEIGDEAGDDMASDEEQAEPGTGEMTQDIAGEIEDMTDELASETGNEEESEEEEEGEEEETEEGAYDASTTPDPAYQDTNYMIKDLAGGLNKEKKMFKHSYKQGDNPMAMEDSVKEELTRLYNEFRGK